MANGKLLTVKSKLQKHSMVNRIVILILSTLLVSCTVNPDYFEYRSISNNEWHSDTSKTFVVDLEKVSNPYQVDLFVRHSLKYSYKNLWLKVEQISPKGLIETRKVELILVDSKGFWKGSSISSIVDYKVTIDNRLFVDTGRYEWRISHLMTDSVLLEINNVGLSLTKVRNGKK